MRGAALGRDLIERADFRDAYRAPLRRPDLGVAEIFFGIFAHRPAWMMALLIARNQVAALAGLETAAARTDGQRERSGSVTDPDQSGDLGYRLAKRRVWAASPLDDQIDWAMECSPVGIGEAITEL
jgi:Protein of unknown function (DUF2867)